MIQVLSRPTWGASILEDTDTGELSFQCICGGVGMYYQRVVLTSEEAQQVKDGNFDADQMVSDVCKRVASVVDRLVDPVDPALA